MTKNSLLVLLALFMVTGSLHGRTSSDIMSEIYDLDAQCASGACDWNHRRGLEIELMRVSAKEMTGVFYE